MFSDIIVIVMGMILLLIALVLIIWGDRFKFDTDSTSFLVLISLLLVTGSLFTFSSLASCTTKTTKTTEAMQGTYKVEGQYITVYTDDDPVKYLIDPVTETVILVTSDGNVALDKTKEELFEDLNDKGFTEYKRKGN